MEPMCAPSYPFLCSVLTTFEVWDNYKAKEFADDEYVWGPDPDLTPLGEEQARSAKDAWMRGRQEGMPLPEAMYCSPLRRAIRTCLITFGGWFLPQDMHGSVNGMHPKIIEVVPPLRKRFFLKAHISQDLRETLGVNTCDSRNARSKTEAEFGPLIQFEDGFVEDDELWTKDHRERDEEHDVRTKRALAKIMAADGACKPFEMYSPEPVD
jgi:broad specificity phosphatase PhoE